MKCECSILYHTSSTTSGGMDTMTCSCLKPRLHKSRIHSFSNSHLSTSSWSRGREVLPNHGIVSSFNVETPALTNPIVSNQVFSIASASKPSIFLKYLIPRRQVLSFQTDADRFENSSPNTQFLGFADSHMSPLEKGSNIDFALSPHTCTHWNSTSCINRLPTHSSFTAEEKSTNND